MLSQTIHVSMSSDLVYVTHLVPCYESDIFSATLSTHRIKLYTFRDDIVAHLSTFTGEGNPIVDQRFSMHSLYVCHENGRLEIWDIRSNKSIAKSQYDATFTCMDVRDSCVAMGTEEGHIYFWDIRKQAIITEFDDTHASSITQVAFHPILSTIFISASDDGMISVFDFQQKIEEDAFKVDFMRFFVADKSTAQAGQNLDPISKFGFFEDGDQLWSLTSQHGLVLWKWKEAMNEESEEGAMPHFLVSDTRPLLAPPSVDYCLSCFEKDNFLFILAGKENGEVSCFQVLLESDSNFMDCTMPDPKERLAEFKLQTVLKGGHSDIVRSFCPWKSRFLLTGGEDSKICIWKDDLTEIPPERAAISKVSRKRQQNRVTPY